MVVVMNQQPLSPYGAPVYGSRNLPVRPPVEFVGRDADSDAIHKSLKIGTTVLLHGAAGIGKSALAASLAAGYAELPGGVLWLDVAQDTIRSLVTRVARAYGLDVPTFEDDLTETAEAVQAMLGAQRPLVVMDGYLDAKAAREFVRECASGVPMLLTHPTLVAGPWTPHPVESLSAEDARTLLMSHAGDALAAEASELAQFVELLAGHPLSIEISARQIAAGRPPDELLKQMPSLPPGQKNRAMGVIMAAYRLLPPKLQGMVMLLGTALAGGASQELLSDVSGARPDVLQAQMQQVVAHGFAQERVIFGAPYYTTHELIQEFSQAFLRGKKRLNTMFARYLQGIPAYIRRHVDETTPQHLQRLATEMPNILAAGLFAAENDKADVAQDVIQLLEMAADDGFVAAYKFEPELAWLKYLVAHPEASSAGILGVAEPEVEEPAVVLDAAPEAPGDVVAEPQAAISADVYAPVEGLPLAERDGIKEAVTVLETELPDATKVPAVALPTNAETLQQIGAQVIGQGTAEDTITQYETAAESFQADGNVEDELAAIEALAQLSLKSENYEAVLKYLDRGTALAEELDNPQREGEMLIILGDLQAELGRLEGAEMAYKEAVTALRPCEAWLNIGLTLEKLGVVYMRSRRRDEALAVWQQALPIFAKEERHDLQRRVLNRTADVEAHALMWPQAQAHYKQAVDVAVAMEDQQAQFVQVSKLGHLLESSGHRDGAVLYYRRALHLAFALDDTTQLGYTLLALARLLMDDTVHLNRALQLLEAAVQLLTEDAEVQRLLGRAKTRRERLMRAGVTLPLSEDSLQDFAREANDLPEPTMA